MRRVVVTGWGAIVPSPAGAGGFSEAVFEGRSAVRALSVQPAGSWPARAAAWIDDFEPRMHFTAGQLGNFDRTSQLAVVATRLALAMAGLHGEASLQSAQHTSAAQPVAFNADLDAERCGIHIGTGMGSAQTMDAAYQRFYGEQSTRLKPLTVPTGMHNAATAQVALETGFEGANITYCCACASSAVAIGEAMRRIRHGDADLMLCGGAEALVIPSVAHVWEALRTLADVDPADPARSCKPFDANRSGLVLGEGACMFVLESLEHAQARGAPILAELVGFATGSDSVHLTRPSVEGQARAMRAALRDADLTAAQIGYINAHGTATAANDSTEAAAIQAVFGELATQPPVSSTKAVHGHLMGAAAAVELLVCLLALQQQRVPPTAHLQQVGDGCALDHVLGTARSVPDLQAAMSNSFAFGGTTGVLILQRAT